jgi:hypothetical protein
MLDQSDFEGKILVQGQKISILSQINESGAKLVGEMATKTQEVKQPASI